MGKENDAAADKDLIELKLKPETAVWLREVLDSLRLQEGVPLEHARNMLVLKDEVAAQLPAREAR